MNFQGVRSGVREERGGILCMIISAIIFYNKKRDGGYKILGLLQPYFDNILFFWVG